MERLNSEDYLQNHFVYSQHWSDEKWKSTWQKVEETRKYFNIVLMHQDKKFLYLRALQGHSGRNLIDLSLQDNVLIPNDFFQYIYHVGCAINLHSIINSRLTPLGQILSNRQTVFFLPVDPMDREHEDPDTIDLGAPRRARYMHKAWKTHQNTVYWVDIKLNERIEVLSNATSFFMKHSQLIVSRKLFGWKLEKSYTRKYMRHLAKTIG